MDGKFVDNEGFTPFAGAAYAVVAPGRPKRENTAENLDKGSSDVTMVAGAFQAQRALGASASLAAADVAWARVGAPRYARLCCSVEDLHHRCHRQRELTVHDLLPGSSAIG